MSSRSFARASLALCIALIATAVASAALAAGYGHGTFKGRVVGPRSGSSADVKIKVAKKVSATTVLHMNDCTGEGTGITDFPIATKAAKINKGPVGGGFAISQTLKADTSGGPASIDLGIVGGIRQKVVFATFDAYVRSADFGSGIDCSLSGDLKAKKK
jgi:hypothetical protein